MDSFNLIVLSLIVKFGRDDSTKEGGSSPLKSNGDLQFLKFEMEIRILHLLENDALLHLSDIFLFNNPHEILEGNKDLVRVKLFTLPHALAKKVISSFLRKS